MRYVGVFERGGEDLREYKKALKKAKESIDVLCELTEEMEEQYSSRGGYSNRYRGDYSQKDEQEWEESHMRRRR